MGTSRAVRYLRSDPVPDEVLELLVWAATRASSADNSQPWSFVLITRPEVKKEIAEGVSGFLATIAQMAPTSDQVRTRTRTGAVHLLEHLTDVPALIVICGRDDYPAEAPEEMYLWGSLHAAAQNMVVAGRAMGLSVVLTMLHVAAPRKVRAALALPDDQKIGAVMAVGWPQRAFGPVARKELGEVIHRERW